MTQDMLCYTCMSGGLSTGAVGACVDCGRSVCHAHSVLRTEPCYRSDGTGINGPWRRCDAERRLLLCTECNAAREACAA